MVYYNYKIMNYQQQYNYFILTHHESLKNEEPRKSIIM